VIGNHNIHRTFFNLGASVNLLLFTVYERLGLGELKSIKMILQLANCSTKLLRGVIEDVLVKVGKFIFTVDFVVLETKVVSPKNKIFDKPFLATSSALINFRNGKMKSTFRNMTIELNVFNLQNQPMGFNDVEHPTLNWVCSFSLKEVEFDHDEDLMPCVYE